MNVNPTIVMTSFEPSGDEFAGTVARHIYKMAPEAKIIGWGGDSMANAGVELIGRTSDNPAMGLNALFKIEEVRRHIKEIKIWMEKNQFDIFVPVDSPAANFPICKIVRRYPVKIIHLVAPQMWAWGQWRLKKLKRLTDLVLCMLPFEPNFFQAHGIKSTFIGHHIFENEEFVSRNILSVKSSNKVVILPGSRSQEIEKNFDSLINIFL